MKILFLCNRDLESNFTLNLLLPIFSKHDVRVLLTERIGDIGLSESVERHELRTAEQTYPNELMFPLIEKANFPDDGKRFLTFGEIERLRGISIGVLSKPNSKEGLDEIKRFAPDIVVCVRYGAILKLEFLKLPKMGVLNLHSGILPHYRGVLATFRGLINKDKEIGCTLHYISDGTIDTGDIIAIGRLPVNKYGSLLGHILMLYPVGVDLIIDALEKLDCGEIISGKKQIMSEGSYYTYPSKAEWSEFTNKGFKVQNATEMLEVYSRYIPTNYKMCLQN